MAGAVIATGGGAATATLVPHSPAQAASMTAPALSFNNLCRSTIDLSFRLSFTED